MTNFDYLTKEPKFKSFSGVAIAAERVFQIDKETSIINCRRAMEFAIKWMYSVDQSLEMPYQDKLVSLMSTEDFHDLVDNDLWKRLDLIRRIGNRAAHNGRKISEDEARLCLQNLFIFMDYLSYCYSDFYEEREYDESLLEEKQEAPAKVEDTQTKEVDLKALIAENKALKEELTARRHEKQDTYVQNRWICPSTRPGRSTLTPCCWMPAGPRAKTGSMKWNCGDAKQVPGGICGLCAV